MLHELLLALFGTTGGLFLEQPPTETSPGSYIVNPKLEGLLSPGETDLLKRIISLGWQYKQIERFLSRYSGISTRLALQLAYSGGEPGVGNEPNGQDKDEVMSQNSGANEVAEEEELHGVYIKALCQGVNDIVGVYKQQLLAIEHEYLKDRAMTIP